MKGMSGLVPLAAFLASPCPGPIPVTGHVYGPDDVIAKALSAEPIEKGGRLTDAKRKKLRAKRRARR